MWDNAKPHFHLFMWGDHRQGLKYWEKKFKGRTIYDEPVGDLAVERHEYFARKDDNDHLITGHHAWGIFGNPPPAKVVRIILPYDEIIDCRKTILGDKTDFRQPLYQFNRGKSFEIVKNNLDGDFYKSKSKRRKKSKK